MKQGVIVRKTRMTAGIITTPNRQQYLRPLVEQIAPDVDRLHIFNDTDMRGNTYNMRRMMQSMLASSAPDEPVLLMCDDVSACPDWKRRWERIHAVAQHDLYVLFTRKPNLVKPDIVRRGWTKGLFPRGYYDQAVIFINRPTFAADVDGWFETIGKTKITPQRAKHYDVVVQEYLIDTKQEWVVTVPTLFDHVGKISTLGHDVGPSALFAGAQ